MKNLFEPDAVAEVKTRLRNLQPQCKPLWGTMNAAQALAHCSAGLESALGDRLPPRMLLGRLFGRFIKPIVLASQKPLRRNAPTAQSFVVADERNFEAEQERLSGIIDRFAAAGPAGCTTHPHSIFGRMRPEDWAVLMYKHLDHHLRQFGV